MIDPSWRIQRNDEGRRQPIPFGMRHAFFFFSYGIYFAERFTGGTLHKCPSSLNICIFLRFIFLLYNDLQWRAEVWYQFGRSRRDAKLDWPWRETQTRSMELATRGSQRFLRLRYHTTVAQLMLPDSKKNLRQFYGKCFIVYQKIMTPQFLGPLGSRSFYYLLHMHSWATKIAG